MELKAGESLAFAFAVPQPQAESVSKLLSGFAETDADELWQKEEARRQSLLEKAGTILPLHGQGEAAAWARDLVLAADSFIVRRGEGKRTVIAGYPWFGDWGRDTMIALEAPDPGHRQVRRSLGNSHFLRPILQGGTASQCLP